MIDGRPGPHRHRPGGRVRRHHRDHAELLCGPARSRPIDRDRARRVARCASEVGTDPPSGLAVLRIADDLPPATFDVGDPTSRRGGGGHGRSSPIAEPDAMPASVGLCRHGPLRRAWPWALDRSPPTSPPPRVQAPLSRERPGLPAPRRQRPCVGDAGTVQGHGTSTMARCSSPPSWCRGGRPAGLTPGRSTTAGSAFRPANAAPTHHRTGTGRGDSSSAVDGARLDSVASYSPAADAGWSRATSSPPSTATGSDRRRSSDRALSPTRRDPTLSVTFDAGSEP